MGELSLSVDLVSIATKINNHKNNIGYSFIEIGKELIRAKEEDLKHGEWQLFLEEINMSKSQADRHIKISKEYEIGKLPNVGNIGFTAMYEIATLPEEKRGEALNEDGTAKSAREIRELKSKNKELEQQAEQAQKQAESERKERERLEEENENIEPEIKEIYIEDEERINNLTKEIEKINDQKEQMENRLKSSENDAEKYRKLQDDIDKLRNEKEDVIRQIDNVSSIGKFISRVERSFEEDLAPVKYSRAIEELERSEVAQESLETIVSKVEKWCNEMRTIMKNNNITEVIEHE